MSDTTEQSEQDSVPQITLRIPGPWKLPTEFAEALASTGSGYVIAPIKPGDEMCLLHEPTGQRFKLAAVEPDEELVELFADSPRMPADELEALRNHNVTVFVTGPGGSHEAARTFLAIGAAFINAGAFGVMVDNSGNCHGPSDWLDLASDEGLGGMYWAFVSVTASPDLIFSAGMHCLGFRDAELPEPADRRSGGMMLTSFLAIPTNPAQP